MFILSFLIILLFLNKSYYFLGKIEDSNRGPTAKDSYLCNICPELVAFLDFGCTKTICFEKDHTRHNGSLVSDWNNFELLFYRILCYICLVKAAILDF
jgi:hypothetical protein